jgi:hypothetical protein
MDHLPSLDPNQLRRLIMQALTQLGIKPGDKLLVRRGEEIKEIDFLLLFGEQSEPEHTTDSSKKQPKIAFKPPTEPKSDLVKEERSINVDKEEWEQLVALAQELSSEGQRPTPQQVGRALLRKALFDLLKGKEQLKEALQKQSAT